MKRLLRQARGVFTPPNMEIAQKMSREPKLKNKVCVISGASRGFGQAIAVRFVEEGGKVAMMSPDCHKETLNLISSIEGFSGDINDYALAYSGDISKEANCISFMQAVKDNFGPCDVLVNNACKFVFSNIENSTEEQWDETCRVNVKGHAMLTKHAIPHLKDNGGGSVVFIGSISSYKAQPDCTTYSTIKGAITQMARSAAYDLAKYNIRVNSLCSGTIETPISRVERSAMGWTFEEWERKKTRDVMLKRVGNVREVANAAVFLASNESSYCTGTDLFVDGGVMACTVTEE
eukprot:TRINITY_DN10159_c0_g1_i1.p1 TRINITY_DN10159_c0_g1~~TRINITY_DN10159_c0_g1_i1.p1  ORF type:complete len:291 (+),score=53.19 TRINITY_DN10159_c0_g1_i1:91-963(+)